MSEVGAEQKTTSEKVYVCKVILRCFAIPQNYYENYRNLFQIKLKFPNKFNTLQKSFPYMKCL